MVSLLLVGDLAGEVPPSFLDGTSDLEVMRVGEPDDALRLLGDPARVPPELVVVAESRGGQFSDASLDRLRQQAPLARIWRLLGSWCEGELRSGRPPGGCQSSYWHRWPAHFGREVARARRGESPSWSLPVTATGDERILASVAEDFGRVRTGTIAICAASAVAASALADLCGAAGYGTLIVADDGQFRLAGATALLWDTTVERMTDAACVARLHGRAGGAPVVALVGFPRADDVERAREVGIAAVVSKPFVAGDVLWHLDQLAASGP